MDAKQKYQMTVLYGQGYSERFLSSKMTPKNLNRIIASAQATLDSGDYMPANHGFYTCRIRIASALLESMSAQASRA